jgi:hypothetical protein
MTTAEPQKPDKSPGRWALEIAGYILGVACFAYAGAHVVAPVISGAITFWAVKKTGIIKDRLLPFIVALQAGHIVWMWLGAATAGANSPFVIETAVYTALLVLLVWQQAKWAAVLLMTYQALGLVVNLANEFQAPFDSVPSRALVVHILIRGGAFIAMVQFLRQKPKEDLVEVF